MKKIITILFSVLLIMSAFIPHPPIKTGIQGVIDPPEAARKIWAISGTDSFSTVAATGNFFVEVKPGNWKLVVESMKPYKNAVIENILVLEGQSADAGVIKLTTE